MNKKWFVMYLKCRSLGQLYAIFNEIVHVSDKLFADDRNILYSSRSYELVENTVNNELDKVDLWLCFSY